MKKLLLTCWLLLLASGICYLFWYHEWKYSLPTPVPQNYVDVKTRQHIDIDGKVMALKGKPVFIHFFNPECPCSKFNVPHFNSLVKKYGRQIDFEVVVVNLNKSKSYTAEEIQNRFDLTVPVSFDTTIESACGVYSTPQAVLLDAEHNLYYRGNYNRARYCTDNKSNYAQMAIDSLLNHDAKPVFSQYALKAYGCQAAFCTK
jgi:thiol-disulfide isomerase/thioredoxin